MLSYFLSFLCITPCQLLSAPLRHIQQCTRWLTRDLSLSVCLSVCLFVWLTDCVCVILMARSPFSVGATTTTTTTVAHVAAPLCFRVKTTTPNSFAIMLLPFPLLLATRILKKGLLTSHMLILQRQAMMLLHSSSKAIQTCSTAHFACFLLQLKSVGLSWASQLLIMPTGRAE